MTLLFMGGRSVSLALPPGQAVETEADVRAWFTTVAHILRQYGSDVLANHPVPSALRLSRGRT